MSTKEDKKEVPKKKKMVVKSNAPYARGCSKCGSDSAYGTCRCAYNQYLDQYTQYCQDVWKRDSAYG